MKKPYEFAIARRVSREDRQSLIAWIRSSSVGVYASLRYSYTSYGFGESAEQEPISFPELISFMIDRVEEGEVANLQELRTKIA